MTVARHAEETLPPLAQRLRSDEGARRLARRLGLGLLIVALGPLLVAGVGALVFFDELKEAHQGGTEVWGLPMVAIGEEPKGWISIGERPVGVVAIGAGRAVGVLAIAPVAVGVVAFGTVGLGVVSVGTLAVGLWSLGIAAIGFASVGLVALGRLASGVLGVGWYAFGAVAVGAYAWGTMARGFFRAESRTMPTARPPPKERLLFPSWQPRPADG